MPVLVIVIVLIITIVICVTVYWKKRKYTTSFQYDNDSILSNQIIIENNTFSNPVYQSNIPMKKSNLNKVMCGSKSGINLIK